MPFKECRGLWVQGLNVVSSLGTTRVVQRAVEVSVRADNGYHAVIPARRWTWSQGSPIFLQSTSGRRLLRAGVSETLSDLHRRPNLLTSEGPRVQTSKSRPTPPGLGAQDGRMRLDRFVFVVRHRQIANIDGRFSYIQPPIYIRFYIYSIHGQLRPLTAKPIEAIGHLRATRTLLPFLDQRAQEVKGGAEAIPNVQDWLHTIGDLDTNITNVNQASRELRMKFPALGTRIMQHEANGAPTREFVDRRERESGDLGKLFEPNDLLLDSGGELVVEANADEEGAVN